MTNLKRTLIAAIALTLPLVAQDFVAKRSDEYNPGRRGGRFDVRLRVNGPVQVGVQGATVRVLRFEGMQPRDAGCEYNNEIPVGQLVGLRLEQRDGRSPIRIVEEPSRRNNYQLILAIDDRQRGDDTREHARITWDDVRPDQGFSNNRGYGNDRNNNGRYNNGDRNGGYSNGPNDRSQAGRFPDFSNRNNGNYNGYGVPDDQPFGNGGTVRWSGTRIPDFMVGNFRGFNRDDREGFELSVDPNGRVFGRSARGNFEGQARDGMIRVGDNKFYVEQTRNGFRTIEVNNQSNITNYRRN